MRTTSASDHRDATELRKLLLRKARRAYVAVTGRHEAFWVRIPKPEAENLLLRLDGEPTEPGRVRSLSAWLDDDGDLRIDRI